MHSWDFAISNLDLLLAAAATAVFGCCTVHNIRHTPRRWARAGLEVVRLCAVALLITTLFEPELITTVQRTRLPVVAVLTDVSASMDTRDEIDATGLVVSRCQGAAAIRETFAPALSDRFDVVAREFPSDPDAVGTDIAAALESSMEASDELRAVILVSDGDWNTGDDPVGTSVKLRGRDVPVFAIGTGSDKYLPDLDLSRARPPAFSIVNEKVLIPFVVSNRMQTDVSTSVVLTGPAGPLVRKPVVLRAGEAHRDSLIWQPTTEGAHHLSLSVPVESGETLTDNNMVSFAIDVRQELLRVLVIESLPRWEYRFLRNALMRDPGVEVEVLLLHQAGMGRGAGAGYLNVFPESRDELSAFDVVFIGDVGVKGGGLTEEQAAMLRGLVENQGSGLVFLPGRSGAQLSLGGTPLDDMLPVTYDHEHPEGMGARVEGHPALTSAGADHLLTMLADHPDANSRLWRQLPGFYWHAAVERARPGASILAVHAGNRNQWGRIPLLVTRPFGNGNVLFLGTDSAWRWRRGVEDKYHYRFWGQVVRWMAHKRHLAYSDGVRLAFSPEHPVAGESVEVNATVLDKLTGYPLDNVHVLCRVSGPDARQQRFELEPVEDGWGVFEGAFSTAVGGDYTVAVSCPDAGIQFRTTVTVGDTAPERPGEPARLDVLQAIARVTNGRFLRCSQARDVTESIRALPLRSELERRNRIWCRWWWGATIAALLAVYWSLRKAMGLV